MPVPTRITATRVYESGMERLDPPPAGAQPRVPASAVWAPRHGSGYRVATYEIVLTSYSGSLRRPAGCRRTGTGSCGW